MSISNETSRIKFRILSALIFTIIFAGSWCLSLTAGNLFWLGLARSTYLLHIGIWIGVFLFVFSVLYLARRRSYATEYRFALFFFIISPLHILDYGMRSVFGEVGMWPETILYSWAAVTLLLPFVAAYASLRANVSRPMLKKVIKICAVPCILFVLYALPSDFTVLKVEKTPKPGMKTPFHLIIFDRLSYDYLLKDNRILAEYPNFRSFSNESDVFLNARSGGDSTIKAIPQLLTGIDFELIDRIHTQIQVKKPYSSEKDIISSYETIFSLAHNAGYNIFLRAFALPYLNNFGQHIQSGRVYPFINPWRVGMHSLIWPIISPGGIHNQKIVKSILRDYHKRIQDDSKNTFFYIHWNLPHYPYIFDENGKMLNRFNYTKELITRPHQMLKYQHQLKGTDKIFGSIISSLKNSDSYDESLIIVTSDTNIEGFDLRHIPLFIKRPYQKNSRYVLSHTTFIDIFGYVKNYMQFQKGGNIFNEFSELGL